MIYPPPSAGAQGPRDVRGKDPDRQLAVFLVVMAIATAALFYAANVRVSSLLDEFGLTEALGIQFGPEAETITDTLSTLETPGAGLTPPRQISTPVPTFNFGGPTVVDDSVIRFPTPDGGYGGFATNPPGGFFVAGTPTAATGLRRPGDFAPSPTIVFQPELTATPSGTPARPTPSPTGTQAGYPGSEASEPPSSP